MRMTSLIEKKKKGLALTKQEIEELIDAVVHEKVPDYQISAFLMAVYFKGMEDDELACFTDAMMRSGDTIDFSNTEIADITVDKHSTGGVGDKTTLILAPLVATIGGYVISMSGRGLSFTGGTLDKLESVPGYRAEIPNEETVEIVKKHGLAIMGQSGNLTPADKKLYALRDVTGTVDSIPLIVSSIMSKKLAEGSKSLVLDVKVGSGAFMPTVEKARELATKMVVIGKKNGRRMAALLTNMEYPLGYAVGNALEVKECIDILNGGGPDDLKELCIALATEMVSLSLHKSHEEAETLCRDTLASGAALPKFAEMMEAMGGDPSYIYHPEKFPAAKYSYTVKSPADGYITHLDAKKVGITSVSLGAGREKKSDILDMAAGILLHKKQGDAVKTGDPLCTLYAESKEKIKKALEGAKDVYVISAEPKPAEPLIYEIIR